MNIVELYKEMDNVAILFIDKDYNIKVLKEKRLKYQNQLSRCYCKERLTYYSEGENKYAFDFTNRINRHLQETISILRMRNEINIDEKFKVQIKVTEPLGPDLARMIENEIDYKYKGNNIYEKKLLKRKNNM